jgi:hypothetical protein
MLAAVSTPDICPPTTTIFFPGAGVLLPPSVNRSLISRILELCQIGTSSPLKADGILGFPKKPVATMRWSKL